MRAFWRWTEVAAQERADRALLQRCSEGDLESLRVLCHRLAPVVYVAAAMAVRTEAEAVALFERMWQAMLDSLPRSRRCRSLLRWMEASALPCLEEQAGKASARRALSAAAHGAETEGASLAAPVGALARVEQMLPAAAQRLSGDASCRRTWTRRRSLIYAAIIAFVAGVGVSALWRSSTGRTDRIVISAIRQHVIEADLAARLREASAQFDSVAVEDPEQVAAFDRIGLVLVELAAMPGHADADDLRWIKERIRTHDLTEFLIARADEAQGAVRADLLRVALVLEEVAAL